MSIWDIMKNSVIQRFDGSISVWQMLLGLGLSLAAGIFILFIYKRAMRRTAVSSSFQLSLLLICTTTATMVLTITSNLALSLGMVGALSIVRFRTAVKDPADTAFLFWAVAAGITAGAGFYLLTLTGCLVGGLVCLLSIRYMDATAKPFLLVIRAENSEAFARVEELLDAKHLSFALTSCVDTGKYSESIYEIGVCHQGYRDVGQLKALPGVLSVSLVDCRKEA
ncbi:MAG: DUF4956 domain-containing protein [Oscillospiraceae bacterium]|nr:DUF4956 domain-containing protein [Oscillospiraceae bacterium]